MDAPDEGSSDIAYAYKPSLLGAVWMFRLAPDALEWSMGPLSGRVPYADIRRIRLAFRPVTMQSYRFLAEIWSERSPKIPIASASWKSLMEQERLDAGYARFIRALHERIEASGGKPRLQAGAIPFLYWPGLAIFLGICAAMVGLIVRAIQQGENAAMLFLFGFFVLLLWQLGQFFKRNLPRRYTLDSIPADILPKVPVAARPGPGAA
ncbi:MAG: hypothetical protein AB7V13_11645 [Pseudorhodoplanes sp.]|uniref:hypothetical protein n=1 Tax=Pseudorhodoplanes sp. TaxID=1934341 RepID=UPI003D0CE7DB